MKCPGQDTQYWKPGAIYEVKCPQCGHPVEFFKDDTSRKCAKCGHRFVNPQMDFGCAAYCQFAEQCLGTLPDELVNQKADLFKERVAVEMKRYYKNDFKRISHASRVARYAERIGKVEQNGNLAVILAAAYLNDIGIHEAERKHGSAAAKYRKQEGPAIAREIMAKLKAPTDLIEAVCDIIGHHHLPGETESFDFMTVHDAGLIADMEDHRKETGSLPEDLDEKFKTLFLTSAGKQIAREVLEA